MPDILTPIRVSELPEVTIADDSDYLIIDDGTQTSRITSENYNSTASGSAKRYADEALLSAQNAETQAQAASGSATIAGNHAQDANKSAQDAEAWAVGKRNGADVPSTDEAYHNNAKYFSEQAHASATEAAGSADDAAQSAASISGLEDQIEQNTEDVTALKSAIEQIEPGLSDEAKTALLNCFAHVAWVDDQGQALVDELSDALYSDYPRITAVFNAGSNVIFADDPVNSLKQYLTVTYYETAESDGAIVPATDYTLTGTLEAGTSTVVAAYLGLTAVVRINNVVDIYNQWEWSYPSALLVRQVGNITASDGNIATQTTATIRANLATIHGVLEIYNLTTSSYLQDKFPIPIPEEAVSVTLTCDSDFWLAGNVWVWDGTAYTRTQDLGAFGYGGGTTKAINPGSNRYLTLVGGMNGNPDLSANNKPTSASIVFE